MKAVLISIVVVPIVLGFVLFMTLRPAEYDHGALSRRLDCIGAVREQEFEKANNWAAGRHPHSKLTPLPSGCR